MATKKGTMFPIFMNIEFNIRQFICTFKRKKIFTKIIEKVYQTQLTHSRIGG